MGAFDNHVHTHYSGHARGPCSPAAIRRAADAVGISVSLREHAPFPPEFLDNRRKFSFSCAAGIAPARLAMEGHRVRQFLRETREAGISLGFEVDVLHGFWDESARIVEDLLRLAGDEGLEVDAINLSHHMYRGAPWDGRFASFKALLEEVGTLRFIQGYFADIRYGLRLGRYEAVSHLEGIRRFDCGLPNDLLAGHLDAYAEELTHTLEVMKQTGAALEVNSSGLGFPFRAPHVTEDSIRQAVRLSVPIVVGSDAHRCSSVAMAFDAVRQVLLRSGVRSVVTFRRRQRAILPLL